MIVQKIKIGKRLNSIGEEKPIYGPDLSPIPEKIRDYASTYINEDQESYTVQINYPDSIDGVPMRIDADQGEILLKRMNMLDLLNQELEQSDIEIQIRWKRSQTWLRYNPFIMEFAAKLGMSDEDLDNFFIEAKKI
jgi:hypothetical protein